MLPALKFGDMDLGGVVEELGVGDACGIDRQSRSMSPGHGICIYSSYFYDMQAIRIELVQHGQTTIKDAWSNQQMRAHYWRLYWNASTGARLSDARGTIHLDPAKLYLIPSLCSWIGHCRGAVPHRYMHFLTSGLRGAWCDDWLERPIVVPLDACLRTLLEQLGEPDQPASSLRATALIEATLATALDRLPDHLAARLADRGPPNPRIETAINAIREHPADDHEIESLARRVG